MVTVKLMIIIKTTIKKRFLPILIEEIPHYSEAN